MLSLGQLSGLRSFIETAELDRMRVLAKAQPEIFYHIMPYALAGNLSFAAVSLSQPSSVNASGGSSGGGNKGGFSGGGFGGGGGGSW